MGQRLENARRLYIEAIRDGNYATAIDTYSGERYTQHSTPVKDGQAGFIEFFADFVERNPIRDIEILRSFEDGPYVFLHVLQTLNNGEFRYVTADIFDTDENARLIEHWDIIAEVAEATPSGHTQLDGPRAATDLEKTEQNKDLVTRYLTNVLATGNHDQIADYVSADSFVQHSVGVADGLDHFVDHLKQLADAGNPLVYTNVHRVIGRRQPGGSAVSWNQKETGQLGKIAGAMAAHGVNIEVLYSDNDHQLVLVVDDEQAAQSVADAWMSARD